MAATVTIRRWTGASGGPTKTDITSSNTRMSTADDPNPGTSNPVPIPGAGIGHLGYEFCQRCDTVRLKGQSDGSGIPESE